MSDDSYFGENLRRQRQAEERAALEVEYEKILGYNPNTGKRTNSVSRRMPVSTRPTPHYVTSSLKRAKRRQSSRRRKDETTKAMLEGGRPLPLLGEPTPAPGEYGSHEKSTSFGPMAGHAAGLGADPSYTFSTAVIDRGGGITGGQL
jgi:hypothetical protein